MKGFQFIWILIVCALLQSVSLLAQQSASPLPDVTSTEGRDFYVAWLPNGGSDPSSTDLKLYLIANSRKANTIIIEYANGSTQTVPVDANSSQIITIDPTTVYWDPSKDEEEKPLNKGVRVYSSTDEQFTLYSINQTGSPGTYSFDGAHILPVEALGTEYMVQTADGDAIATEFVIMSTKPGQTNVSIDLPDNVNSRRGNTQHLEVTLDGSKQIYIVRSQAPNPEDASVKIDLSGSTICADQPIAVWSGNQFGVVPNQDGMNNDHAYDQLLPLNKWGKQFVVPPMAGMLALNMIRIVAMQDNTSISMTYGTTTKNLTLNSGETSFQRLVINDRTAPLSSTRWISADKPIQVYLYSTSAGANTWYDDDGNTHVPSDPSVTLIPPVEYLTDTTIFSAYNGGDGTLSHFVNLWATSSKTATIQLDGNTITGWTAAPGSAGYSMATVSITTDQPHIVTAPDKCFSGYAYGINDGQAYLYPVGYDFTPKQDSLFLLDNDSMYTVRPSEWRADYISTTEGGWYLDRVLQDDDTYLLDSIFVCDSTTLTFPIKTYSAWYKTIWEIEGSIQGSDYFTPVEQLSTDVPRPELEHPFTLLPKEENDAPFEDFEVRGIVIRKPFICEDVIDEDKWERDTFNTVVRVMRQYNDTTWRAICMGDTVQFFSDTVWMNTSYTGKPQEGVDFTLQKTIFNDTTHDEANGYYQYQLGSNVVTRSYISSGGCDSLSTIKIFVCSPSYEFRDTTICQNQRAGLNFGEFFKQYTAATWPIGDTILFDTIRAKGCMSTAEFEPFKKHCPDFNGCDSVMELHLDVKKLITNSYTQNQCLSQGETYEWYEKESGRLIRTFDVKDLKPDTIYTFRDTVQYSVSACAECPDGGCDSVRNILRLQFVSDAGQKHTVHVCQGKDITYRNMSASLYFNSVGKLCNTPYVDTLTVIVYGPSETGTMIPMCEFEDEVTFYVDTVYNDQMTYDTICYDPLATGQTYAWEGHLKFSEIPISGPGLFTYRDTMKTYDCHCDSICVLSLRVGEPYEMPTVNEICDDDSFTWQDTLFYGVNYKGSLPSGGKSKQLVAPTAFESFVYTSQRDTISQYGCDSILTLSLTIHPTFVAERKDTAICANEPYFFYGEWYNTPDNPWKADTTYSLEIHDVSIHGCDSAVLHYVKVYPTYLNEREENDTVCQQEGAYYTWENHPLWTQQQSIAQVGNYELIDSLISINGCDSVIHRTLVVLPTYDLSFKHMMSSEDTLHWEGRIYAGMEAVFDNPDGLQIIRCTGANSITDSLFTEPVGTHSCDSVRTLALLIGQVFRDTTYDATCANCTPYEWVITSPITGQDTTIYINDIPAIYQSQFYYDSLYTELGFDSIYVRQLTTYPNYEFAEADSVCQGEEYTWSGHTEGAGGVTHRLFVNGQQITSIPTNEHGTITVTDSMTTTETYTHPQTGEVKAMLCDSVWTLTLTIHPTYNDRYVNLTDYRSMSSNDTLSHFTQPHVLFVGYDFDSIAAGINPSELTQYDSVVYLYATGDETWRDSVVNSSIYGCDSVHYVHITICEIAFTEVHDSIADNDTTWYFGGDISQQEHTLPLITGEKFHYYDDGTPVDYSQATGRTERNYFFIDTMRTTHGCDSIVHNHLSVFPAYRFPFDTTICSNVRYDWRKYTYLNRAKSGYVYDSVNYQIGTHTFDSVYVLNLEVVPSGYWQYDTVLCMNDTLYWHHQKIYYQPGGLNYVEAVYKDATSLCGDIYHMNLTFMPYYGKSMIEYDTICQDVEYHWISPGETNEHLENLRDGKGNQLLSIPTDRVGAFTYYDSLKTAECGCDSVYTLQLVVNPTYRTYDTTFVLCSADTLFWQEREYVYEGERIVRDTIYRTAVNGCDSIHYMKLEFDLSYDSTTTTFLCSDVEHYQWEDIVFDDTLAAAKTWTEPRSYHFDRTYPTQIGQCDSVLRLDITIAPNFDSIWTDTICQGETYMLFDRRLTEAGTYYDTLPNPYGCRTFYTFTLVVQEPTQVAITPEPVCVDEEGQANTYLLRYTYTGEFAPVSYTLRYDSAALAQGFEDLTDEAIVEQGVVELPVPSYTPSTAYPRPGKYTAQIGFENGVCLSDSLMTYTFTMEMNYPAWITEQRYGDMIAILNDSLNGGYTWSSYQWYEGDSVLVGQTKPYLYIPTGLTINGQYHVMLTREGETEAFPTCPITIIADPNGNTYMPLMGYLSVTPTCVVRANPTTNILSRKDGTYRITNSNGVLIGQGDFSPDATPIQLPAIDGLYIIQLWSPNTPEEPYRAIKVLVKEICESCATSF